MRRAPDGPEREQIERAILKTVLYSDLFDYALTPAEVAHYLVGTVSDEGQIREILCAPHWLDGQIRQLDGYVTMRGRESLVNRRRLRARSSHGLWRLARSYAKALSRMPFVRMVAVTGALAMDNSDSHDDVDILLVTAPGRVWLARAFAILVVRAGWLSSARLCPNYVLSQEVLSIEPQSIYVAHEFVQMVPMYGLDIYRRLKAANPWAGQFLPNATKPLREEPECRPGWISQRLKNVGERLLGGSLGDWLEAWEMRRKISKFIALRTTPGSVIFNRDQVKGHFDDHGARISALYQSLLERFRVDRPPEP